MRWLGRWYRLESGALSLEAYEAMPLGERSRRENSPSYDGRMDGRTGLFCNYSDLTRRDPVHAERIHLHNIDDEWPGPACIGGVFHWETFVREELAKDGR